MDRNILAPPRWCRLVFCENASIRHGSLQAAEACSKAGNIGNAIEIALGIEH